MFVFSTSCAFKSVSAESDYAFKYPSFMWSFRVISQIDVLIVDKSSLKDLVACANCAMLDQFALVWKADVAIVWSRGRLFSGMSRWFCAISLKINLRDVGVRKREIILKRKSNLLNQKRHWIPIPRWDMNSALRWPMGLRGGGDAEIVGKDTGEGDVSSKQHSVTVPKTW